MENPAKIRTFFALPIEDEAKKIVTQLTQDLSKKYHDANIKWTSIEKFHITTRFLGETSVEQVPSLIQAMQIVLNETKEFAVTFSKCALFPGGRPHSIVIHLTLNEALAKFYRRLDDVVAKYNFPAEKRPYLPHLTLARIEHNHQINFNYDNKIFPLNMVVNKCIFYQTQTIENGSVYLPLAEFLLIK